MTAANIGHLYYREYYKGLSDADWMELVCADRPSLSGQAIAHINSINGMVTNACISNYAFMEELCRIETTKRSTFDLKTIYPGLLVGAGWSHSAGNIDGEFKLGFYFDHTTGQPVIPGSSIKGLLRSAFLHEEYVMSKLKDLGINKDENTFVYNLKMEIFEGIREAGPIPMCKRDIFFDAYIVASEDRDGRFLAEDYITPHKAPCLNPIPLKFLKVLPGVTFRFQFDLKEGAISAIQKKQLFKEILLELGAGAKTNVGYGQFVSLDGSSDAAAKRKLMQEEEERRESERKERIEGMPPVDRVFEQYKNDINLIVVALQKNEIELNETDKLEVAKRIKAEMVKKKIWDKPKKPKDKIRVGYVASLLDNAQ